MLRTFGHSNTSAALRVANVAVGLWWLVCFGTFLVLRRSDFGFELFLWTAAVLTLGPVLTWKFAGKAADASAARQGARDRGPRFGWKLFASFLGLVVGAVLVAALLGVGDTRALIALGIFPPLCAAALSSVERLSQRDLTLTIGVDGATFTRAGASSTFAHGEVAAIKKEAPDVRVVLRDGRELVIDCDGLDVPTAVVHDALQDAAKAAQQRPLAAEALRREGRDVESWREAILARTRGSDYRERSLGREDLVRVLEHPGSTAEERIGAALALRAMDADGVTHVRAVADATVSPATREALAAVRSGHVDEEMLKRSERER